MTVSPALLAKAEAIRIADERPALHTATLPLVVPSVANLREHHHAKAKRMTEHRHAGSLLVRGRTLYGRRLVVLLTRIAPRELDDDNLASALKAVRDGVADGLGVDDRDPRVTWLCDQRKGKPAVQLDVFEVMGVVYGLANSKTESILEFGEHAEWPVWFLVQHPGVDVDGIAFALRGWGMTDKEDISKCASTIIQFIAGASSEHLSVISDASDDWWSRGFSHYELGQSEVES